MTLATLLQRAWIWRAGEMSSTPGIPTGFPVLDALLPGGGWPRAALTEILAEPQGIGALRLVLPALAGLSRTCSVIWVSPPHIPYAPALAAMGMDLARVLVVEPPAGAPARDARRLWAFEQALRFPGCGAALVWPGRIDPLQLRRLQLACEAGDTWGIVFRPRALGRVPSPAALRLALLPDTAGGLRVTVLKCRGGVRSQVCRLEP